MDLGLPDAARFGQLPLATAWEVGFPSCGRVSNFPNRGKQGAAILSANR